MMNNQKFYKEVGIPVAKKGYPASVGSWPLMAVKNSGATGALFRGWHGGRVLGD